MRFYKVSIVDEGDGNKGAEWFRTKREAERCARKKTYYSPRDPSCLYDMTVNQTAEVEAVDITPTKAGILTALRRYASHPDNG